MFIFRIDGGQDINKGRGGDRISVGSKGKVSWLRPIVMKIVCNIDVAYFPFDDQQCDLKFGPWQEDASQIDMGAIERNTDSNYIPNGEWNIIKVVTKKNLIKYQCCPHPYADVTATVYIRRQSIDYILKFIIPCCLISTLIFLTFMLPPASGERVGLSVTILLAITVFQQLASEFLPPYGVPLISQYFISIMFEVGICLVFTTIVLNFFHREDKPVPRWMQNLALGMGCFLLVSLKRGSKDKHKSKIISNEVASDLPHSDKQSNNHQRYTRSEFHDIYIEESTLNVDLPSGREHSNNNDKHEAESDRKLNGHIATTCNEMDETEDKSDKPIDWQTVSYVFDRLFMVLVLISTVATVFGIFSKAPRFFEDLSRK